MTFRNLFLQAILLSAIVSVTSVFGGDPGICCPAPGTNATFVGPGAVASGDFSSAYGAQSNAAGEGSVAIGSNASAATTNSVAIGSGAFAESSVAVGGGAQATGTDSTAVGDNAVASGDLSSAYGNNANAAASNSVALGNGSVASQANTVSVGAPGSERRVTNVAPGVEPTDAVNMGQFGALKNEVGSVARQAYRGIAGVAALTSGAPAAPGKTSVNLGIGGYRGYVAGAVTASRMTENGKVNFNGGIGISGGQPVFRAGVGFSF